MPLKVDSKPVLSAGAADVADVLACGVIEGNSGADAHPLNTATTHHAAAHGRVEAPYRRARTLNFDPDAFVVMTAFAGQVIARRGA
jgi:hypothetical protein